MDNKKTVLEFKPRRTDARAGGKPPPIRCDADEYALFGVDQESMCYGGIQMGNRLLVRPGVRVEDITGGALVLLEDADGNLLVKKFHINENRNICFASLDGVRILMPHEFVLFRGVIDFVMRDVEVESFFKYDRSNPEKLADEVMEYFRTGQKNL